MKGVTRRLAQAGLPPLLCPSDISICSGLLLFSSTLSMAHFRKIVALCFSDSSRACPVYLCVEGCMKQVSPGGHVLQKSCAYSLLPSRARIPAKSQHPWPLSPGPVWQSTQRNSRKAPLSFMFDNLRLLRGHRLVPNSCNSCTSIPPTSSASLTLQSCSAPSLTRSKPHQGHLFHLDRGSHFHWPLSSESGDRPLCSVSCLAS